MFNESDPIKMWSGRFREPLNKQFEEWQRSFPFDWRLLPQEIAASKAHAKAIAAAGILSDAELTTMLAGLDQILAETTLSPALATQAPKAEDIHHFSELELAKYIGELALKLHTGRSRNEQIVTDMRLFVRDAIDQTVAGLKDWTNGLIELAELSGGAVMPAYTHLQRAEPVLIAHWLLAYVSMIERDISRFTDARKRMNLCPLGSGAIAGATLALDRTIAAGELGFDSPTANSLDATSDRDFLLDFAQAASTLGVHISRFAEELTLHATAEFGFLDLPEAFSTGSSAMPQKKKPRPHRAGARQIRASARRVGDARHTHQGSAARLQQGPAGRPGADLRHCRHVGRYALRAACLYALTALPAGETHGRRFDRLPQRHGRRDLSLEQGSSLPQGA